MPQRGYYNRAAMFLAFAASACGPSPSDVLGPNPPPPAPATLRLVVETTGLDYDPDGYLVSIDGAPPVRVSHQATLPLGEVLPGRHTATVSDIAPWCRQATTVPSDVEVAPIGDFRLRVLVQCESTLRDVVFYVQHGRIRLLDLAGPGSNPLRLAGFDDISCDHWDCSQTAVSQPSVSPDGRILAYATGSMYLFRRAGTTSPSMYLFSPVSAESPLEWSPDGAWIVFADRTPGQLEGSELLIRPTSVGSGNGGRQLTFGSEAVFHPTWSPDGEWIAFERWLPGVVPHIWKVRPDGTGLQRFNDEPTDQHHPQWSPDGSRLVYRGQGGIRIASADGHILQTFTGEPFFYEPDFSADGKALIVVHARVGCRRAGLARYEIATGLLTELIPPDDTCMEWDEVPWQPASGI